MNNSKQFVLSAVLIIVCALVLRSGFMLAKKNFHVDESISIALTDNNWPKINDTGFKDQWITKAELDSRVFNRNIETSKPLELLAGITAQTSLDVHPPLYYWLLAFFRLVFGPSNFAFAGFMLNAILFVVSCFLLVKTTQHLWNDRILTLLVLSGFAFSTGAISSTLFIRMYELLQTICLWFLYETVCLLFPTKKRSLVLSLVFLFIGFLLGLLTHYYFLFFVFPIILFALVYLLITKRVAVLLWCVLAVIAALYIAYKIFPAMGQHLFGSYRAGQSVTNLAETTAKTFWEKSGAYIGVLSKNLLWPGFIVILLAVAGILRFIEKKKNTEQANGKNYFPGALLLVGTTVFIFTVISLSAPYQTGRYVIAFFPLFALAITVVFKLFGSVRIARICTLGLVLLIIGQTSFPPHINPFHEDYVLDDDPAYLTDEFPVAIISTKDAWSWKNMLPYINIGKNKKIYVTDFSSDKSLNETILNIAQKSGSEKIYVFLDDYFMRKPFYSKIGFYGFFEVYSVNAGK